MQCNVPFHSFCCKKQRKVLEKKKNFSNTSSVATSFLKEKTFKCLACSNYNIDEDKNNNNDAIEK
jgi:hypothetical protein